MTSKLNNAFHGPDDARRAFEGTLEALGFDHVDLFLIHWPLPTLYDGDFVSTWRTLEEFKADGRARSIGVSNFQVEHLERLAAETDTVPAVNQIELHPYFQNREVRAYDEEHGIATEAWSPIAQGEVLDDAEIGEIAEQRRPDARPGGAPLAHPARQHRVPEVDDARADQGELRALRLRARRLRARADRRAGPGRGRPKRPSPRPVRLRGLGRLPELVLQRVRRDQRRVRLRQRIPKARRGRPVQRARPVVDQHGNHRRAADVDRRRLAEP